MEQKMDDKGVKWPHSWIAQEMEITQWEAPGFFLKLTFHMKKTFKTWDKVSKTLQLPHTNKEKFWPNVILTLS